MQSKIVEKERFTARTASGQRLVVVVSVEMLHVRTLQGDTWEEGLLTYRLASGQHVNVSPDGTMAIAATGEQLQRV